ncbi:pentapeptide repeat-containing protein [Leptothoe kymatousa TAU-MAC 1615]|uniref:Pentapeptide repeat-containing protein n=2 Tax=Leptothoe TaxID=2651725 RepID=A0ABS5XZ45_9CYAN|nr:pentapeptide repeat-containing protein [Leptothoe kymatousa TAU-MAC 1615]
MVNFNLGNIQNISNPNVYNAIFLFGCNSCIASRDMANQDQITILNKGVEVWNNWRKSSPNLSPDLSGYRIENRQLPGINLSRTNLKGTKFVECNINNANFQECSAGLEDSWNINIYFLLILAAAILGFLEAKFGRVILILIIYQSIFPISMPTRVSKWIDKFFLLGKIFFFFQAFKRYSKLFFLISISLPALAVALTSILGIFPVLMANVIIYFSFLGDPENVNALAALTSITLISRSAYRGIQYAPESRHYPEVDEIFNDAFVKIDEKKTLENYPKLEEIASVSNYPDIDALASWLFLYKSTQFIRSELVDVNFTRANLKFVDFSKSYVLRCNFFKIKGYQYLRLRKNIFSSNKVISLAVDRFNPGALFDDVRMDVIKQKSFRLNNFSDLDLEELCLRDADLININLSNSNLKNADLSKANLTGANLTGADLTGANLTGANVKGVNFENAVFEDTILTGLDFSKSSIKGANFKRAQLDKSNFQGVNISKIDFSGSSLIGANLLRVTALETNFSKCDFTGACIEDWNINRLTSLEGVVCDYIFLKTDNRDRRPGSGNFKPGDFFVLVKKTVDTIDLVFSGLLNWQSLLESLRTIQEEYGNDTFPIQSLERKDDDGFVIKLNTPPDLDEVEKRVVERRIRTQYETKYKAVKRQFRRELTRKESKLKSKDIAIRYYKKQSSSFLRLFEMFAVQSNKPNVNVNNILESKVMQGDDNSRNLNVGGDLNASNSNLNLGDISGQLSNLIKQIPPTPLANEHQFELKELLSRLQNAVEQDSSLNPDEKLEAIGEMKKIAKAAITPNEGAMKRIARRSMKTLAEIASILSNTSEVVKVCKDLLPVVQSIF